MLQIDFHAFGCTMRAVVDAETADAAAALEQVPAWFERWEQHLSRFREDSELSLLSRQSGHWVPVSATLWQVARAAAWAARESDGLVVPTLLGALEAAGYDRTFSALNAATSAPASTTQSVPLAQSVPHDRHGRFVPAHGSTAGPPAGHATQEPHAAQGHLPPQGPQTLQGPQGRSHAGLDQAGNPAGDIRFRQRGRLIMVPAGASLDLGGVAKGWAAARASSLLSSYGPALVDAGGDVAASGPPRGGRGWPVGIAAPFTLNDDGSERTPDDPDRLLTSLLLRRGGVATSGKDYRRWRQHGAWQHHIVDPRTGRPAQTDVLSVTVQAPSVLLAEVAAKVALILGSDRGRSWLEARPALAGLLALDDGRVLTTRGFPAAAPAVHHRP